MKIRTIALIGTAVMVLGGMSVVACSSSDDSSGNPSNPGEDAGNNNPDTGSVNNPDTGTTGGDDSGNTGLPDSGGGDSGPCKSASLHVPVADGGIYCPYSFNDATDAGIQYCTNGAQECCLSPGGDAGPSVCQTFDGTGAAFNGGAAGCATGSIVWQCSSPADCVGNGPLLPVDGGAATTGATICCLVGGALQTEAAPYCSGQQKTHFGGTTCQPAAACAGSITIGTFTDPLYTVCEQQSDCTGAGQTCTAIYVSGTSIGVCLPQ